MTTYRIGEMLIASIEAVVVDSDIEGDSVVRDDEFDNKPTTLSIVDRVSTSVLLGMSMEW